MQRMKLAPAPDQMKDATDLTTQNRYICIAAHHAMHYAEATPVASHWSWSLVSAGPIAKIPGPGSERTTVLFNRNIQFLVLRQADDANGTLRVVCSAA